MKKRLMSGVAAITAQRILAVFSRLLGEQEMGDLFAEIYDLVEAGFEQNMNKGFIGEWHGHKP